MNDKVFYQRGLGFGAIIDGTIGFEFYETKFDDGKDMQWSNENSTSKKNHVLSHT